MAIGKESVNLMGNQQTLINQLFAERTSRLKAATKENQMPDHTFFGKSPSNRGSSRLAP
jgi:hypothetical protein